MVMPIFWDCESEEFPYKELLAVITYLVLNVKFLKKKLCAEGIIIKY